ncbi:hypothetical protein [Candidatus Odyssella thessalonicensis]|uniref:hypothetical protein n=1 Tax=Candidatus Odyssella thessalonicensis TaxID=84647 RepID=UPI000225ABB8|nr:hypothetical protein [Candidatus Odyssella thessalonicensis]
MLNHLLVAPLLIVSCPINAQEFDYMKSGEVLEGLWSLCAEEIQGMQTANSEEFEQELINLGLTEQQLNEIKNLPKPVPTPIPSLDVIKFISIEEGDGIVVENPQADTVLGTCWVEQCIGLAILTPTKTLFAHLNNDCNGVKHYTHSLPKLLGKLNSKEYSHSKAILISSYYSYTFVDVYNTLKQLGVKEIYLDIDDLIHDPTIIKSAYLQAKLGNKKFKNKEDLSDFLSITHSITTGRNFVINAKTGGLYYFNNPTLREVEAEAYENYSKEARIDCLIQQVISLALTMDIKDKESRDHL